MIESLIFMFLVLVGVLGLGASIALLIIALIKKARTLKIIGLCLLCIPITCFSLIFIYYNVFIPSNNRAQENEFSGLYVVDNTESANNDTLSIKKNTFFLRLNIDNTFELDSTPCIDFRGKGTWISGSIDGQMEFKNEKGEILGWASPFENDGRRTIYFNLYDSCQVRFIQR